MKKVIPLLIAAHVLLMIAGFWLLGTIFVSETRNLLGAVELESTAADGVRVYLESDIDFSEAGEAVLQNAGYSYSADHYILRKLLCRFLPAGIILILAVAALGVLEWRLLQKAASRTAQAESERNCSVQKAAALERELEDKMREVGEYEENLYHQLKTALTGMQLRIELLPHDEDLQIQLQKMTRLVTLFLRERKLSSNMVKFHYRTEALDEILDQAVAQLQPYSNFHQVALLSKVDDLEYYLHCDPNWLSECLVTLLENSIEHAAPGSSVELTLHSQQKNYVLSIRSYGELISQSDLESVFRRFHSSKTGHFGIGLAMARQVILQHHGQLKLYNHPDGDGVMIDIHLPRIDSSDIYA